MAKSKILYVSQEIAPYIPDTEMSKLGHDLSQLIQSKNFEVRTFMPRYGCINERRNQLHEVIRLSGMNIIIDDTDHPLIIKVATLLPTRMQVYFIDSDDYFHKSSTELEIKSSPQDNDERIMFFVRGVVETVKKLRWEPNIVHCSGWISALAPVYLKRIYNDDPSFRDAKIVYSIFDDEFDGALDVRFQEKMLMEGFSKEDIASLTDVPVDKIALNKLAIDYADAIVQASPTINPEIEKYAKESGKPFLQYPGDADYVDAYAEFYNSL